ncbi:MAG: hypothetical protein ACRERX_14730 [Pseudomonas sp.]
MEMLLLGRGQIAVGSEHQTLALLKDKSFKDRIEVLPEPFMQAPGYMGVGKAVYVANQQVIERIWTTIGEIHAPDQWRKLAPTLAQ